MLGISTIKGQPYTFSAKLYQQGANTYRVNPTLAAGDFLVETWDYSTDFTTWAAGTLTSANITNLPKIANASSSTVLVYLTAAEMAHDVVIITAADVDGLYNSWANNCWVIYPDVRRAVLRHKKTIEYVGSVAHLRVYATDGVTLLMDKILKDATGLDLSPAVAGMLAQEQATTV